ncbi:hypothetical protein [Amycolatopsis echigonensis]|uniref:Secreted protein n=1 Tax=Amycolatopsis echigonensis TaxID=2576905 RepID=A0A2N3WDF4_9PSEU|nr:MULTISPECIES: hypothetical protein [Amycolatopsis]MBB2501295.1 hypothetical protein [Amycolatopsis echigonensis]PKV91905.1 hypothetical protein ATK30_2692 [Amycolatopsis niigatensis]
MTTTSMRRPARWAGLALSLALSGLCLTALPAQAAVPQASAPAAHQEGKKTPVHIKAGPVKAKVHKGEQLRIHGHVATGPAARGDGGGTLYLQQETQAGVWVNLVSTSCSPDSDFDLGLQLNVSGTLTLRVFHPESTLFAAAASAVFTVVVL